MVVERIGVEKEGREKSPIKEPKAHGGTFFFFFNLLYWVLVSLPLCLFIPNSVCFMKLNAQAFAQMFLCSL